MNYDPDRAATAARTRQRAEALTTGCPYCCAQPGKPCFNPRTKIVLVKQPAHFARLNAVTNVESGDA